MKASFALLCIPVVLCCLGCGKDTDKPAFASYCGLYGGMLIYIEDLHPPLDITIAKEKGELWNFEVVAVDLEEEIVSLAPGTAEIKWDVPFHSIGIVRDPHPMFLLRPSDLFRQRDYGNPDASSSDSTKK